MTRLSSAICFAAAAHSGAVRKGTDIPYIVHPMETAAIVAAITSDEDVIAAAVLHDVVEDCGVGESELRERFGERVAELVMCETEVRKGNPRETWEWRKAEAIRHMRESCREAKVIALADKLSNMRSIRRDYDHIGDAVFLRFNQHDKRRHAWYYRSCLECVRDEFGDTDAWREMRAHVEAVFGAQEDSAGGEGAV